MRVGDQSGDDAALRATTARKATARKATARRGRPHAATTARASDATAVSVSATTATGTATATATAATHGSAAKLRNKPQPHLPQTSGSTRHCLSDLDWFE